MKKLYDQSVIINYDEGDKSLERVIDILETNVGDISHIIKQGDTLQNLADFYLGSSLEWFIIADYNKIDDIFNLQIGTEIIIPKKY